MTRTDATSPLDLGDLTYRSASALAAMIRRRTISCSELLDAYLGEIAARNEAINAVVTLDEEHARAGARAADEAIARGQALGPLHGLPMTIKDSYETVGMTSTSGAPIWKDHVAQRDADAVARLKSAGALVFGKTNLPLMASNLQTFNALYGATNNPHDHTRTCGGSSGGAAAAVAAGLTALELGSDIGGSIRTPAHWNGVYGHKPSHGIVPLRGHLPGPPGTLSTPDLAVAGPLARSAQDLRLALDVLAGPDAASATAWRLELPRSRHTRLSDFRVAAWLDDPRFPVDDAVRAQLEASVEALRRVGVKVDEKARPPGVELEAATGNYLRLLMPVVMADVPRPVLDALVERAETFDPEDESEEALAARAPVLRHREWLSANERRHRYCAQLATFFADYDVLLCPVTQVTAPPHDHTPLPGRRIVINGEQRPYGDLFGWIALATMCLLPATSAPIGLAADGLPVGIQIVGPYLEDHTTIEFARLLEDVVGGYAPPVA